MSVEAAKQAIGDVIGSVALAFIKLYTNVKALIPGADKVANIEDISAVDPTTVFQVDDDIDFYAEEQKKKLTGLAAKLDDDINEAMDFDNYVHRSRTDPAHGQFGGHHQEEHAKPPPYPLLRILARGFKDAERGQLDGPPPALLRGDSGFNQFGTYQHSDEDKVRVKEKARALLEKACKDPKVATMDKLSMVLFNRLVSGGKELMKAKSLKHVGDKVEDDSACVKSKSDDLEDGEFKYPKRPLMKIKANGKFWIPKDQEEPNTDMIKDIKLYIKSDLIEWLLNERLPMSDETDRTDPPALFFESNEEAAVYFNALLKPHLPTSKDVRDTNEKILIEASLGDIAFNGLGQWFLSSVQHDENGKASWEDREAMECKECIPPKDSCFVVDVSRLADFPVRQAPKGTKGAPYEYENYGAACFFDLQHAPIALWIPNAAWNKDYQNSGKPRGTMYYRSGSGAGEGHEDAADEDWEYAAWRWRCSLYYHAFAETHLVYCHWLVSNTLVTALRERLSPEHPVRLLMWPFADGCISINYAASINLASKRGFVSRATTFEPQAIEDQIKGLAGKFRYESFTERMKRRVGRGGEQLPMRTDGVFYETILTEFVGGVLDQSFLRDDAESTPPAAAEETPPAAKYTPVEKCKVTDDPEICEFWKGVKAAAMGDGKGKGNGDGYDFKHDTEHGPRGLPPLSFDNLVAYLVHCIFYSTAVHELLGNILLDVSVPTNMSPRILPQRIFKEKGIKPQASVQEWFRISCTCASVATLPRPKLMPEMLRLAEELEASSKKAAESGDLQKSLADGRLADIYRDFHGAQYDPRDPTTKTELRKNSGPENGQPRGMLTGLSAMQKSIMDRNSSGAFGNAYLSPFGDFTPKRFEVAVSL